MNSNNNSNLWENSNLSFDIPSNAEQLTNPEAEKPAQKSVVGDHHKVRLDTLKSLQNTNQIKEDITPPIQASVENFSFDDVNVEISPTQTNKNYQSEAQVTQTTKPISEPSLIDSTKNVEEFEQPQKLGFAKVVNNITEYFRVDDASNVIGNVGKKGGVFGADKVENFFECKITNYV
ncbi:hypothetical protein HC766_02800 [Candidatus Gracilibacteria bacterium]|nr:hypothetical protein [Candidatus Gracilibacteria bacterium]